MKIEINDMEVYDSNTLVLTEKSKFKFKFENGVFSEINIDFSDETLDDNYKYATTNGTILHLKIPESYNNGFAQYIQIGHLNNRELWFNYSFSELETKSKLFNYIFLLGKTLNS